MGFSGSAGFAGGLGGTEAGAPAEGTEAGGIRGGTATAGGTVLAA